MNFFSKRRDALGLSQRAMAIRVGVSNTSISNWEDEINSPTLPVAVLAQAYDVTESKMANEVMALRRRIEAREAKQTASAAK